MTKEFRFLTFWGCCSGRSVSGEVRLRNKEILFTQTLPHSTQIWSRKAKHFGKYESRSKPVLRDLCPIIDLRSFLRIDFCFVSGDRQARHI